MKEELNYLLVDYQSEITNSSTLLMNIQTSFENFDMESISNQQTKLSKLIKPEDTNSTSIYAELEINEFEEKLYKMKQVLNIIEKTISTAKSPDFNKNYANKSRTELIEHIFSTYNTYKIDISKSDRENKEEYLKLKKGLYGSFQTASKQLFEIQKSEKQLNFTIIELINQSDLLKKYYFEIKNDLNKIELSITKQYRQIADNYTRLAPLAFNKQDSFYLTRLKQVYNFLFRSDVEPGEKEKFEKIVISLLNHKTILAKEFWREALYILKNANYIEFDSEVMNRHNSHSNLKNYFTPRLERLLEIHTYTDQKFYSVEPHEQRADLVFLYPTIFGEIEKHIKEYTSLSKGKNENEKNKQLKKLDETIKNLLEKKKIQFFKIDHLNKIDSAIDTILDGTYNKMKKLVTPNSRKKVIKFSGYVQSYRDQLFSLDPMINLPPFWQVTKVNQQSFSVNQNKTTRMSGSTGGSPKSVKGSGSRTSSSTDAIQSPRINIEYTPPIYAISDSTQELEKKVKNLRSILDTMEPTIDSLINWEHSIKVYLAINNLTEFQALPSIIPLFKSIIENYERILINSLVKTTNIDKDIYISEFIRYQYSPQTYEESSK